MTNHSATRPRLHTRPTGIRLLAEVLNIAGQWRTRRKARFDLSRLDAHMLADIGLDQTQAYGEASKPFWRD